MLFRSRKYALNKLVVVLISLPFAVPGLSVWASETAQHTLSSALVGGKPHLDLRFRHEQVSQEGFSEDADATTLRLRLNYGTADYRHLSLFGEVDSVLSLGGEQYNSGAGTSGSSRSIYPVVADPDGTEVNQLYVQYKNPRFLARIGRQRILLDNQRFVGGVGWRQNEQTYDSVMLQSTPTDTLTIKYAYIDNVNRIFGDDVNAGDHAHATHLLNIRKSLGKTTHVTGHWYRIRNNDVPGLSTVTYGISAQANMPGNDKLKFNLDLLEQNDTANNPDNSGGLYWHARAAYTFKPMQVYAGIETLPGHSDTSSRAFFTPLATLHAFNGWADKFLATPAGGLSDYYVGLTGSSSPVKWQLVWHTFDADKGSADYGNELDISLAKKFYERYQVLVKFADFNGKTPAFSDTRKIWIMMSTRF